MKKILIILVVFIVFKCQVQSQPLFPYTLGAVSVSGISESADLVRKNLESSGFRVLGEYMPAEDKDRWVIVITSDDLLAATGKVRGLTGFASALRIGLTIESDQVKISYTTPEYWLNAYYRDDFDKVKAQLDPVSQRLVEVMKASGRYKGSSYGSEKGIDADDLRSYRYMVGMQKFHNTVKLAEFSSYQEAIDKIESNCIKGLPDIEKVYSVEISESELKLYGFGLGGEKGESRFLPIIDFSEPKHTAFLPYELLVMGNEVHMLHGRFRIALSFPDLTMGTFTKIMSSPGDIKDLLQTVVE